MPCYDPDDHHHVSEIEEVAKKLHRKTDMLCRVMTILQWHPKHVIESLPKDVLKWWESHKKYDKEHGR